MTRQNFFYPSHSRLSSREEDQGPLLFSLEVHGNTFYFGCSVIILALINFFPFFHFESRNKISIVDSHRVENLEVEFNNRHEFVSEMAFDEEQKKCGAISLGGLLTIILSIGMIVIGVLALDLDSDDPVENGSCR